MFLPFSHQTNLLIFTDNFLQGTKPALFVPDRAFEVLAQKQIGLLRQPSLQVVESIFNELSRVLTEVREKDVGRFYKYVKK